MSWLSMRYRFTHWMFQWKRDDDGDIAFVLFNWITFIKYKEHTIVKFCGRKLPNAGKYQGKEEE